jgi:signal transduction histidine kinase
MHATGPAFVALSPLQQGGELLGVLVRGLRIDHGFAARVPALSGHDHAITFGEAVLAQQWHVDASTADLRPLFELAHAPRSLATRDLVLRIDDVEWPGVCVPLHADGGIVFLAQDLRGIHALRDRTLAWLIVLGGVLGLAGLFWAIRTAKRLARPLQDLTAASERMRAGDLATRVARLDHDDELGRLAHSFNTMADTVQALVADVTDKAHRAEAANVAKDRFLTSVSHELRTPLTGIQSTAELLQQFGDSASPTERAEFLDTILRESERLGRRIGDALDYANLSGGRTPWTLGRVDLQAVCEGACRRLDSLQAMKPVSFLIMVEADAVLQGDREHLTQAVWHLVHNAWQWSPVGGAVDVTGRAVPNGFVLEVADRGPGVPAVDRERVFDTFAQGGDVLVDKPAGIGIGLKIAREVAIAHGGTVDYSDRPGGGACFRMLLRTVDRPIDRMVSAPEAHPEPVAPAAGT